MSTTVQEPDPAAGSTPQPGAPSAPGKPQFIKINRKIYPRSVKGIFARWRWIMFWAIQTVFYGLCWVPWNGRQAFLCDLTERKFYFFDLVFWPQDVIYLALLLIISAYGLFLFTAIGGRLFCGYACPQTLFTEWFLWIEEKIEGPYNVRQKLDQEPMSARKLRIKLLKHGVFLLISVWTGFTFVGYFTPIRTLMAEVVSFTMGPWEIFWVLLYGLATYGNAGFLREQVCLFMCPYARFQSVMFDPDTLTVTYDKARGENRGARKKNEDYKAAGKGDCVDCNICVQVCPTGIDIRDGLQYECIGCSACIDACDQVMDKVGYPRGLIRYSTENALVRHWGAKEISRHLVRPRTLIYGLILAVIVAATAWGIATRVPLRVDVIRDRGVMSRELDDGRIENLYRLQVINVSEAAHRFSIAVRGAEGVDFEGDHLVEVPPSGTLMVPVVVRIPAAELAQGKTQIWFDVARVNDAAVAVHEKATFLKP
ncbi:MAG: cytochrome c oxidase accessory protein CcoG [Sterolibacterium sp.]|nr:cytochrome c oxidase accessory protein CcoG [Sterolibacterium sp.]MBP9799785.1 cytochrome c oxidase accessory protein CcoG [Sterolibacterium sp.]